jgi:hypothetical protein
MSRETSAPIRWGAGTRLMDSRRGNLTQLVDDAIKPLRSLVTGGRLDLSALWMPEEPTRYVALTFEGVLTSDQTVVVSNRMQWWWLRNETTGPFALRLKTSLGVRSNEIPQGDAWQLVHCDGNDSIVLSPARVTEVNANGWLGNNKVRALNEIFRVARVPADQISDDLSFEVSLLVEDAMLEQRQLIDPLTDTCGADLQWQQQFFLPDLVVQRSS